MPEATTIHLLYRGPESYAKEDSDEALLCDKVEAYLCSTADNYYFINDDRALMYPDETKTPSDYKLEGKSPRTREVWAKMVLDMLYPTSNFLPFNKVVIWADEDYWEYLVEDLVWDFNMKVELPFQGMNFKEKLALIEDLSKEEKYAAIRYDLKVLYSAIEGAKKEIDKIQDACPHPYYSVMMYMWRVGSMHPSRICGVCGKPLGGITEDEKKECWREWNEPTKLDPPPT